MREVQKDMLAEGDGLILEFLVIILNILNIHLKDTYDYHCG
jgi:hypothetical protein